jgi:hypothetical protein
LAPDPTLHFTFLQFLFYFLSSIFLTLQFSTVKGVSLDAKDDTFYQVSIL